MSAKEQETKEDLRKVTTRRTLSDRRESLLDYELQNFAKPDSRDETVRRSGKERRAD